MSAETGLSTEDRKRLAALGWTGIEYVQARRPARLTAKEVLPISEGLVKNGTVVDKTPDEDDLPSKAECRRLTQKTWTRPNPE